MEFITRIHIDSVFRENARTIENKMVDLGIRGSDTSYLDMVVT